MKLNEMREKSVEELQSAIVDWKKENAFWENARKGFV